MAEVKMMTSDGIPVKPPTASRASSRVKFEEHDVVRKWGDHYRLRREVDAMTYVQNHTSVPIPAVIEVHLDEEADCLENWFLMQRIPGVQIDAAWPIMDEEARSETVRQLRSHLRELHELRPPSSPSLIGSVSSGPAYDHRLTNMSTCEPFASAAEFHDFLAAEPVKHRPRPEMVLKLRSRLPDTCGTHFAHADLSWENILVDPSTGHVNAILDWEMAGFWPEWWEYRKALFGGRSRPCWWRRLVGEVMREFPEVTDADMDLEMF